MYYVPQKHYDLKKAQEEAEEKAKKSLVIPLANLQRHVAARSMPGHQEKFELYAVKGETCGLRCYMTPGGINMDMWTSEPQLKQTGSKHGIPPLEFVRYLSMENAKEIARKLEVSLG